MVGMVACGSKVDHEAMKDKVLDAHDEVMPKMGQLVKLKKQVLAKANELDSASVEASELKSLATDLENAYQGMMSWMHDWSDKSGPFVNGEAKSDEITAFYEAEQKKVDKVKSDINASIAKAEKVLQ